MKLETLNKGQPRLQIHSTTQDWVCVGCCGRVCACVCVYVRVCVRACVRVVSLNNITHTGMCISPCV